MTEDPVESWELFLEFLNNAQSMDKPDDAINNYCNSIIGMDVKDFIIQGFPDDLLNKINVYLESKYSSYGSEMAFYSLTDAIDSLPVLKIKRRVCLV